MFATTTLCNGAMRCRLDIAPPGPNAKISQTAVSLAPAIFADGTSGWSTERSLSLVIKGKRLPVRVTVIVAVEEG